MYSGTKNEKKTTRRALFLDRDGVINIDHGYVYRKEEFDFIPGIFKICQLAISKGFDIIVVTNQAGIGRGYYTLDDFNALTHWMIQSFLQQNIPVTAVYYCPDHPEAGIGPYRRESFYRKPNPGMLFRARNELGIDLPHSILIGDKESDIQAAIGAGIGVSVRFGRLDHASNTKADLATDNFEDIYKFINDSFN